MTPTEFISRYTEYFGGAAPLPIAVVYSDKPMGVVKSIPGCMFKQFHHAYNSEIVTLDATHFTCGGGKLYAGLGPTPERVYNFVYITNESTDERNNLIAQLRSVFLV